MSATVSIDEEGAQRSFERCPTLFVVLQGRLPLAPSSRHLLTGVDTVRIGRGDASEVRRRAAEVALVVADASMSAEHAVLRRGPSGFVLEDLGSKNGTLVRGKRVQSVALADGDVFALGHTFFLFRSAFPTEPNALPDETADDLSPSQPSLATFLAPLARVYQALGVVAPSTIPILVGGETGTGKEVVARAAHALSRRTGSFVAVNCGALPATLVESELFGFKRGAFSGATQDKPGLIRSADQGTLFLDEIGDLPLPAQTALLRALQEREVLPIGASQPVKVDFRLVSATHKDLRAAAARGSFRSDLLARLTGLVVELPSLRTRREDLGIIASALLLRARPASVESLRFSVSAGRCLLERPFRRNVRELERMLATAVLLAGDGAITEEHLLAAAQEESAEDADADADEAARPLSAADVELRERLVALFQRHGGNVSAVAREMGKARFQVHRWMRRLNIDPSEPR